MRSNNPHHKVGEYWITYVREEVTEIDRTTTDLHEYESSADLYNRRARFQANMSKGDWWIGVGLYLVLLRIAFAVF